MANRVGVGVVSAPRVQEPVVYADGVGDVLKKMDQDTQDDISKFMDYLSTGLSNVEAVDQRQNSLIKNTKYKKQLTYNTNQ